MGTLIVGGPGHGDKTAANAPRLDIPAKHGVRHSYKRVTLHADGMCRTAYVYVCAHRKSQPVDQWGDPI